MKPIIGVVGRPNFPNDDSQMSEIIICERYRKQIIKNGGIPILILPPKIIDYNNSKPSENSELSKTDEEILKRQVDLCDGILIPGGYKVFSHDFFILDYAIEKEIPVFAICLGMQIMSNYKQDYYNEKNNSKINHYDFHGNVKHLVKIDENSKLYSILGKKELLVNSIHNYHAVKGGLYNIVAKSEDGQIEALEMPGEVFNIGVQWHPEIMDDEYCKKLFTSFISSCKSS